MEAINIKAFTEDVSQVEAIKAFMKTLKIKFEVSEKQYNSDFVAKIKQSESDFEKGNFTSVSKENINNYIDNL
ncbi:MAG: hypothetical protein H7174_03765 [Flavobacterium sp.]|nr:hypothetical protein [Flavobacterium sp.]